MSWSFISACEQIYAKVHCVWSFTRASCFCDCLLLKILEGVTLYVFDVEAEGSALGFGLTGLENTNESKTIFAVLMVLTETMPTGDRCRCVCSCGFVALALVYVSTARPTVCLV